MQRRGTGPTKSRVLLAVATLSFAGFVVLAAIAAQHHLSGLDQRTRALVQLTQHPFLDPAMRAVSYLGDSSGLIPLIALASGLLWRASRRWALALPLLMAGTGGLQLVAKWVVDRPRPNLAAWGFPSGHVLSLVVFFGLMTYLLCTSGTGRSWRCLGSAGCATTVLAVAFSRLYLGVHWVSDVGGGFMLGLAYLLPAIWLVETVIGGSAAGAASLKGSVETALLQAQTPLVATSPTVPPS